MLIPSSLYPLFPVNIFNSSAEKKGVKGHLEGLKKPLKLLYRSAADGLFDESTCKTLWIIKDTKVFESSCVSTSDSEGFEVTRQSIPG